MNFSKNIFFIVNVVCDLYADWAQAGVEYEDARIERDQWAALKATVPMGQLPCIEVE